MELVPMETRTQASRHLGSDGFILGSKPPDDRHTIVVIDIRFAYEIIYVRGRRRHRGQLIVRTPRQRVGKHIELARLVFNLEVVFCKE